MTTPSAGVVYSLANELGISLDFLFGAGDVEPGELPRLPGISTAQERRRIRRARPFGRVSGPDGAGIVQRADDRNTIELSTGVRWERLTPTHDSKVDFIEIVYEPSGQSTENGRALRHDGREYLYVLEGELEAVVGFETLRLVAGDSMAFDPATPHHYRNPTSETVSRAFGRACERDTLLPLIHLWERKSRPNGTAMKNREIMAPRVSRPPPFGDGLDAVINVGPGSAPGLRVVCYL